MRANANKGRQTLTNASKSRGENVSKRKQNASKRGQTQTNAYTPLYCVFYTPPFAIPLFMCLCMCVRVFEPIGSQNQMFLPNACFECFVFQFVGGGVPATPDTLALLQSMMASQYIWEPHRGKNGWCNALYINSNGEKGILLQKHRDRNGTPLRSPPLQRALPNL